MMKTIKNLYYDYFETIWYSLALVACVLLSHYLSHFIPLEFFSSTLSPILHGCIAFVAIAGAITLHWHTYGIRARRVWQVVLIVWALIELNMFFLQYAFAVPTMIMDVHTVTADDLVSRDLLAFLFLAYPLEVLYPHWLKWWKGVLIVLPPLILGAVDHVVQTDLRLLLIIYPLVISMCLFILVREYRKRCEENFSTLENTGVMWVRNYLVTLIVMGLSYFYLCASGEPTRAFTQELLALYLITFNTAQILFRKKLWQMEQEENAEEGEEDPLKRKYREKLEKWMVKEKPYLNPEFRLTDLTHILPMNRTYLSNFINGEYGCNFCQYVTNYRIEEAKRLMREHPEMKMQDIAEQSGFTSPATFARSFSKETDMSPTEWIKTVCDS